MSNVELDRECINSLRRDLQLWSEEGPPAPYKFAEWAALLEHKLGLTEPFQPADSKEK